LRRALQRTSRPPSGRPLGALVRDPSLLSFDIPATAFLTPDTGIDLDHPDLRVTAGTNCVTPGASPDDYDGHGTYVPGTSSDCAHCWGPGSDRTPD